MINNNKCLKIREKRDNYLLKSKHGKIKIYNSLAKLYDNKLNKKYKYQIIKIPSNYDIKNQIEDNPQFELLKDRLVRCATRNKFYISDYDEKVNKKFNGLKKHTIVKRFIDNKLLNKTSYYGINIGAILLSLKVNGTLEPSYLLSSLLLTLPFKYYTACESHYSKYHIDNIDKYDILNKMEEIYQTIINNFCLFIYQLKIKNPLDILFLYDATISRICTLSNKDSDKVKETTENIEAVINRASDFYSSSRLGYNVVLGYAVCRNQATIFRDICIRLGFDAKICGLKYERNFFDYNYHAVVLVNHNGTNYILDPEHLANYKYEDNKFISEDGMITLKKIEGFTNKISFKCMGFDLIDKNINNISYVSDITESYNLLMDDIMIKRINKFNNNNDGFFIKFYDLFKELIELNNLDNSEKTLIK